MIWEKKAILRWSDVEGCERYLYVGKTIVGSDSLLGSCPPPLSTGRVSWAKKLPASPGLLQYRNNKWSIVNEQTVQTVEDLPQTHIKQRHKNICPRHGSHICGSQPLHRSLAPLLLLLVALMTWVVSRMCLSFASSTNIHPFAGWTAKHWLAGPLL